MATAYLDTRVSLYRERFWSDGQYAELIDLADADLAPRLAGRGLASLAAGPGGDAGSLEGRIVRQLLDETLVLLRPLAGAERQFLLYWISRFEISNVKTLIRAKMAGERPAGLAGRLIDLGAFTRLDADDLMHADDATELLRRLERSPYADIVRHARLAFEESRDPFLLDATLDRAYHEGLIRHARALPGKAGQATLDLVARLIDRTNLVWLLRYRFNYGLPPAQVYYLLVAPGQRLGADRLRDLVARPDPAAVLAGLPGEMRAALDGADGIAQVAARLERLAVRGAGRVIASDAPALARAYAYLMLRELNLRKVRAVLRGRHLGLPGEAIRRAIGLDGSRFAPAQAA
jgi:V/A-type H+-transporting ATPase subunit C